MTPWAISFAGQTWDSQTITTAEAVDIALMGGAGWSSLDPYSGPGALATIVSVLAASRLDKPLEDVMAEVRAMLVSDLMGCLVGGLAGRLNSTM